MIGHQTTGMNLPARLLAGFRKGRQKTVIILGIAENRFAAVAAIHHMINRPRILDSQPACHGRQPPIIQRGFSLAAHQ
jgi:hypothetical protein